MGRIIVSENISIDGVIEDPWGDDGRPFGGWHHRVSPEDLAAWAEVEYAEALAASALLLGRGTYDFFAPRWIDRGGAWGDRMRELPKHVVSSTLREPTWANTFVLAGDPAAEVASLKKSIDGEIVVYGSGRLVRTLVANDLVDEFRFITFPFVLGAERLFDAGTTLRLRLLETRRVGSDLMLSTFETGRTLR